MCECVRRRLPRKEPDRQGQPLDCYGEAVTPRCITCLAAHTARSWHRACGGTPGDTEGTEGSHDVGGIDGGTGKLCERAINKGAAALTPLFMAWLITQFVVSHLHNGSLRRALLPHLAPAETSA